MLNRDFNNGKKLNLVAALAVFTMIMGVLFLIAATPGTQTFVAVFLIFFGVVWFIGNRSYVWWGHQH
jgi:hypothetical protein